MSTDPLPDYMNLRSLPTVSRSIDRVWELDAPSLREPLRQLHFDAMYLLGALWHLGQPGTARCAEGDRLTVLRDMDTAYRRSKGLMLEHMDGIRRVRPDGFVLDAGLGRRDYGSATRAAFVLTRRYADRVLPDSNGALSPEGAARQLSAIHPEFSRLILSDPTAFSVCAATSSWEVKTYASLRRPIAVTPSPAPLTSPAGPCPIRVDEAGLVYVEGALVKDPPPPKAVAVLAVLEKAHPRDVPLRSFGADYAADELVLPLGAYESIRDYLLDVEPWSRYVERTVRGVSGRPSRYRIRRP